MNTKINNVAWLSIRIYFYYGFDKKVLQSKQEWPAVRVQESTLKVEKIRLRKK